MSTTMSSKTTEPTGYEVLGRFTSALLLVPMFVWNAFLRGFVLSCLWGWFVTPVFGLAVPPLLACIGLSLMAGYLVSVRLPDRDKTAAEKEVAYSEWRQALTASVAHLLTLGIGWLIHCFM